MNRRLRDHLSRGFSLTLGHDQCRGLVAVHIGGQPASEGAWSALELRGLIRTTGTEDEPDAVLTGAGNHVVQLLIEAGLYEYYDTREDNRS